MRQLNKRSALIVLLIVGVMLAISSATFAANPVTVCTSSAELEAEIANGGTITFNCGTAIIPIANDIDLASVASVGGGAVVIDGGGTITLNIDAGSSADARAFDISAAVSVTLQNLTITGGSITGGGLGGAIRVTNGGTLNLINVVIEDNEIAATGSGGAVSVVGATVNVTRSAFLNNAAIGTDANGGVFSVGNTGILNVANSTFSGNTATGAGGVLRISGTGIVNFTNNTFVGNTAVTGGQIVSAAGSLAGVSLKNNILVGAAPATVFCSGVSGAVPDLPDNLLFNGACTGLSPESNADPLLIDNTAQAIPHYGIPTNSPAVNLVDADSSYVSDGTNPLFADGAVVTIDQANQTRPSGAGIDAGSFEFQGAPVSTSTPTTDASTATATTDSSTATATTDASTATATTDGSTATSTSTIDPLVTPSATATIDPNITPTETATIDPNITATATSDGSTLTATSTIDPLVTPSATSTTDPNVTPAATGTSVGTATSTAVPVPGAFNLVAPADGALVRDPSTVTAITWGAAASAEEYRFILFKLSDNTRLGIALDLPDLTPAADTDPLACTTTLCTLSISADIQAALSDGQYAWTVFAGNSFGETEADNAPYFFTVNTGNLNLIVNGGFEDTDQLGSKVLAPWTGSGLAGDKIKCNKDLNNDGDTTDADDKIFSFAGECAFQFKGSVGENSKIQQNADFAGLVNVGDSLTFNAQIRTNLAAAGKVAQVKIKYTDITAGTNGNGKDKLQVVLTAPTTGGTYQLFTGSVVVDSALASIKVQLKNKNVSGKVFFDEVELIAAPAGAATATPQATATDAGVTATATTDAGVTATATIDPLFTATATSTVDPLVTPSATSTVDPLVTPTVTATADASTATATVDAPTATATTGLLPLP